MRSSEKKKNYSQLPETTMDAFVHFDMDDRILETNIFFDDMLGYSPGELQKRSYRDITPARWHSIEKNIIEEQVLPHGFSSIYEKEYIRKDGTVFPVELRTLLIRDDYNQAAGIISFVRDITERKEVESQIEENNRILSLLNNFTIEQAGTDSYNNLIELIMEQLESCSDAILVTFSEYNPEKKALISRNVKSDHKLASKAIGIWGKDILNVETPVSDQMYREITSSVIGFRSTLSESTQGTIPDFIGSAIQKLLGMNCFVGLAHVVEGELYGTSMIGIKNEQAAPPVDFLESYAFVTAISLRRLKAEERMRYLSWHDYLTGLFNRHFLEAEMQRLDTERQLPISIIMADLNGLKLVNDTYGHSTGDLMLQQAADILRNSFRSEDIIARWGGDEIVICLPQTDEKAAQAILSRVKKHCSKAYIGDIPISMALGLAVKDDPAKNIFTVFKEAEDSMYKNKLTESRSGKSSTVKALLKTLADKSFETEVHTQRMQETALVIGENLGLVDSELKRLNLLISLHDIGKVNIPEDLLVKKEELTDKEWKIIKEHPETGFRIARATEEFAHVAEDILAHHEQWDGSGYPHGLKEEEIPMLARITAIADAYEVMSSGRPYKKALSPPDIVAEFNKCAGSQFDPELVDLFLKLPIITKI